MYTFVSFAIEIKLRFLKKNSHDGRVVVQNKNIQSLSCLRRAAEIRDIFQVLKF